MKGKDGSAEAPLRMPTSKTNSVCIVTPEWLAALTEVYIASNNYLSNPSEITLQGLRARTAEVHKQRMAALGEMARISQALGLYENDGS